MDDAKCPVMHGALTKNQGTGTSNKEWWPNQLNLSILHQHDMKSNPNDAGFDYREAFKGLDYKALKQDLHNLTYQFFQVGLQLHIQESLRTKKYLSGL